MAETIRVQVCLDCWRSQFGELEPEREKDAELQPCHDCEAMTGSGIFTNRPVTTPTPDGHQFTVTRYERVTYTGWSDSEGDYISLDLDTRAIEDIEDEDITHVDSDMTVYSGCGYVQDEEQGFIDESDVDEEADFRRVLKSDWEVVD